MRTIALFMLFLFASAAFGVNPATSSGFIRSDRAKIWHLLSLGVPTLAFSYLKVVGMRNFPILLNKELMALKLKTSLGSGRFAIDPDLEQKLVDIQFRDAMSLSGIVGEYVQLIKNLKQYTSGKKTLAQVSASLMIDETLTDKLARLHEFTDNYSYRHGLSSILRDTTQPNLDAEQLLADYKQIMTKFGGLFHPSTLPRAQATQQQAKEIFDQAAETPYAEAAQQAHIKNLLEAEVIKLQGEASTTLNDHLVELGERGLIDLDPNLMRLQRQLTNLQNNDPQLRTYLEKVVRIDSLLDEHLSDNITLAEVEDKLVRQLGIEPNLIDDIIRVYQIYRQYQEIAVEQITGELPLVQITGELPLVQIRDELPLVQIQRKYLRLLANIKPFLAEQNFQLLRGSLLSLIDFSDQLYIAVRERDRAAAQVAYKGGGDLHKVMGMLLAYTDTDTSEGGRIDAIKFLIDLDYSAGEKLLNYWLYKKLGDSIDKTDIEFLALFEVRRGIPQKEQGGVFQDRQMGSQWETQ